MKHITIIAILFAGLICLTETSKSKQLFDAVNEELSVNNNKIYNQNNGKAINSIFSATEEENKNENSISFAQKNEKNVATKSLFDDSDNKPSKSLFGDNNISENLEENKFLNNNNNKKVKSLFVEDHEEVKENHKQQQNNHASNSLFDVDEEPIKPQVKLNESIKPKINLQEKKIERPVANDNNHNHNIINNQINSDKNNKHIFNKNNNNSSSNQKKAKQVAEKNINIPEKIIDDRTLLQSKSEIDKLKSKVMSLISINKQLMKELEKKKKLKKQSTDLSEDLINLIETHQTPIMEYESDLRNTQAKASEKLTKKESELNHVYSDVRKGLDNLLEKVDSTKNSLSEIQSDETLMSGELKRNYNTDHLTVLNNVQVEGQTNAHIINTESVDIGNIKIDLEKISITNPQTEIIVGSEILSVKELMENLEILEKLNARCGENLENCIQYNDQHFEMDMQRQNEIIEDLRVLRKQTKDIIRNKVENY